MYDNVKAGADDAGIASLPKDLSGFFQSTAAEAQPNFASWSKERGEVVLQVQEGQYIQAFQVSASER